MSTAPPPGFVRVGSKTAPPPGFVKIGSKTASKPMRWQTALRSIAEGGAPGIAATGPMAIAGALGLADDDQVAGLGQSIQQGYTLGFGDEIKGVGAGVHDAIRGGSFGEGYARSTTADRGERQRYSAEHPVLDALGTLQGGLALPIPGGTLTRPILEGAKLASRYGLAYGVGSADPAPDASTGEALLQRGAGGAYGAVGGAALGSALPAAGKGIGYGVDQLRRLAPVAAAERRVMRGSQGAADDYLALTMQRAGMTPQQVEAELARGRQVANFAGASGPLPETLADAMGDAGQRALRATTTAPGRASTVARQVLDRRQEGPANPYAPLKSEAPGQRGRLLDNFARALRIRSKGTAYATEKQLADVLAREAAPAYRRGWTEAEEFDISKPITDMMGEMSHLEGARLREIRGAVNMFLDQQPGKNYRPLGAADELQRFDSAKRGLDDMIGAAKTQGRREAARRLTIFKNELLDAVHGGSRAEPTRNVAYAEARDLFSGTARMGEAIEKGRGALREGAEATAGDYIALQKGEQEMYRLGLLEAAGRETGRQKFGGDATQLFRKPNTVDLLRAVIPEFKRGAATRPARQFGEIVNREERMARTRNMAHGGSPTAPRAAELADFDRWARFVTRMRSSGVSSALVDFTGDELMRQFGMREDMAFKLARMLLNPNPAYQRRVLQRIDAMTKRPGSARMALGAVMAKLGGATASADPAVGEAIGGAVMPGQANAASGGGPDRTLASMPAIPREKLPPESWWTQDRKNVIADAYSLGLMPMAVAYLESRTKEGKSFEAALGELRTKINASRARLGQEGDNHYLASIATPFGAGLGRTIAKALPLSSAAGRGAAAGAAVAGHTAVMGAAGGAGGYYRDPNQSQRDRLKDALIGGTTAGVAAKAGAAAPAYAGLARDTLAAALRGRKPRKMPRYTPELQEHRGPWSAPQSPGPSLEESGRRRGPSESLSIGNQPGSRELARVPSVDNAGRRIEPTLDPLYSGKGRIVPAQMRQVQEALKEMRWVVGDVFREVRERGLPEAERARVIAHHVREIGIKYRIEPAYLAKAVTKDLGRLGVTPDELAALVENASR